MKKFWIITILIMLFTASAPSAKTGDAIGYSLYTDIGAYINNYPIKSFNVDGYSAIIATDLKDYGFSVIWDEGSRNVQINKVGTDAITPKPDIYLNKNRIALPEYEYLETDITASVDGAKVPCYNINGRAVIIFDSLSAFGEVVWDEENREISLNCEELPVCERVKIPENPNVIKMYAADGRALFVGTDEIEAYKRVGWYDDISEVTKTLYSADGRTMTAFLAEVPLYLTLGWYEYPPSSKMVALTFDDGPSKYTDEILNVLGQYGAKATFFVVGNRVNSYQDTLKRAFSMGMEIGNHSYSHPKLTSLSWGELVSEKDKTDNNVIKITGANPTVFRPPYGSTNQTVADAFGRPVILWSLDTLDWKSRNKTSVVNEVINNVKDGDIILMHDLYSSTLDAVREIVPHLINEGYQLVTVSQLGIRKGGLAAGQKYSQIR